MTRAPLRAARARGVAVRSLTFPAATVAVGVWPWSTVFSTTNGSGRISSSPIFADEIRDTGSDYVALGHQHVQTNVSQGNVTAFSAGAPVIEWADERPDASVLRIDFSEYGVRVEPRPLD